MKVLDAVGLRNGPAHTEVKVSRGEAHIHNRTHARTWHAHGIHMPTLAHTSPHSHTPTRPDTAHAPTHMHFRQSTHAQVGRDEAGNPDPVLLEVNGRWHATHFQPLTDVCIGQNALDATVVAAVSCNCRTHEGEGEGKGEGEGECEGEGDGDGVAQALASAADDMWAELPRRLV